MIGKSMSDTEVLIQKEVKNSTTKESLEKIKNLTSAQLSIMKLIAGLNYTEIIETIDKIKNLSEYDISLLNEFHEKEKYFVGVTYPCSNDIMNLAQLKHVEILSFICAPTTFSKFGSRLSVVVKEWGSKTKKIDKEYFYKVSATAQRAVLVGYTPYFKLIDPYRCKLSGHDWKRLIKKNSKLETQMSAEFKKDIDNQEFVKKLIK